MINLLKNNYKLVFLVISVFDIILFSIFTSQYQLSPVPKRNVFQINESFVEIYSHYRKDEIVNRLAHSMDNTRKIGQIFMLSIPGTTLDAKTIELLQKYNIGGIALLGKNIQNETQLKALTQEIYDNSDINPFIAVDQEGRSVNRIYWDTTAGKPHTIENSRIRSSLLISLGINMNLAPIADIPLIQKSFIKNRAIGNNATEVTSSALIILAGHEENNVLTSTKHFPGHGRTTTDSHKILPIIGISKEELTQNELVPFKKIVESGAPAIMTGHLLFPQIDSEPASLSKTFQTNILRNEMGFSGLIISDDMNMGGITNDSNRFDKALKAGTNMIIYVQSNDRQIEIINSLIQRLQKDSELSTMTEDSIKRILLAKCKYKILEECN
ncbi:glycoside hydrolase family 3 protein [Candidatus Dojkabacteria bacterium]|nr:glycoside hydrolase family 3 protein [Candidatus Dojkabacteria bacterium]